MSTEYGAKFIDFMNKNPTVFHVINEFKTCLENAGFVHASEESLQVNHNFYVTSDDGSALVAFKVGSKWTPGDPVGVIGCHVDALGAKLKPHPKKPVSGGFSQLGAAPYGGGMNQLWFDRDLGLGGRVILKSHVNQQPSSKLVLFNRPMARIPTLAPHFGAASKGPFNPETQMTPIYGLESSQQEGDVEIRGYDLKLLKAIARQLNVEVDDIFLTDLELFDCQPATFGGLDEEFIFCGRLDDRLCSFAALHALIQSKTPDNVVSFVALFNNEEIGSLTRQGAMFGGLLFRALNQFMDAKQATEELKHITLAKSFFISSDVAHAFNPNFPEVYDGKEPRLNVGPVIKTYSSMRTTTDAVSEAFVEEIARKSGIRLQNFQVRNDVPSGGTIGPMVSAATGMRAVDLGIPQLSMHSIRAMTGSRDVDLGFEFYKAFYETWDEINSTFDVD